MTPSRSTAISLHARATGGFTLIELMVTIAIAAILTVIAAPSFTQYQRSSELNRSASAFLATMAAARAESMKRQLNVVVRPNPTASDDWRLGWTSFVDTNWNAVYDTSTDVSLLTQDALPSTVTVAVVNVASDATSHYVIFNGAGYARDAGNSAYATTVQFTNAAGSRLVKISPSGRMRVCNPVTDTTCTAADTF